MLPLHIDGATGAQDELDGKALVGYFIPPVLHLQQIKFTGVVCNIVYVKEAVKNL